MGVSALSGWASSPLPAASPAASCSAAFSAAACSASRCSAAAEGWISELLNQGSSPHGTGGSFSSARASLMVLLPFLIFMSKTVAQSCSSRETGLSKAKNIRGLTGLASSHVRAAAIRQQRGSIA